MRNRPRYGRGVTFSLWILCTVGVASAADSGFYLNLDQGEAVYPASGVQNFGDVRLTGNRFDRTDFTWDFGAGYRFNRYFSLEAGYVDLGERSGLISGYAGKTLALGDTTFAAKGETLAAIGVLPFGKWEAFFKAGILRGDAHIDFSGAEGNAPLRSRLTIINTHPLFGIGMGYNITDRWHLRFGLDTYRSVGSTDELKGIRIYGPNINTLTVGVAYRF